MKKIASGGFEIDKWDEKPAGITIGPKVTRATVTQRFTGDIKGTGTTEYVMVYRADKTADYSGVQVINGTVGVRKGSFALLLRGKFDGKKAVTKWEVVPGASKGALKGLSGKGEFGAPMGSKGQYKLNYELPG
ncbi:MAG TPA: DUF3224 domain-containing protein [Candidatus Eisenbacteria bacterium]|nr:DUF3224 domain-containing protein [Candidatus Eisenbacteria bacterium]